MVCKLSISEFHLIVQRFWCKRLDSTVETIGQALPFDTNDRKHFKSTTRVNKYWMKVKKTQRYPLKFHQI